MLRKLAAFAARRAFLLINLGLAGLSGYFIYYWSTALYREPPEIEMTLSRLDEETDFSARTMNREDPTAEFKHLDPPGDFMRVLIELTPTPTPTPKPTPKPIPLADMIHPWIISSITEDSVTVRDRAKEEEIEFLLNGDAVSVTVQGQTAEVRLCGIDLDSNPFEAKFCDDRGEEVSLTF